MHDDDDENNKYIVIYILQYNLNSDIIINKCVICYLSY